MSAVADKAEAKSELSALLDSLCTNHGQAADDAIGKLKSQLEAFEK